LTLRPDAPVVARSMILCVTLNPCLDKTLTAPDWSPGDDVRGTAVREVVGGKGNNVARALARLGRPARPATFFGGAVGDRCEALLRSGDGFDPLVTRTEAPTREILTVRSDRSASTAFFDPDPAVSPGEAEALLHRVEGALAVGGVEALTLSGSSPSPATHGLFSDLIALAKARPWTGSGASCPRRSSSTGRKPGPTSKTLGPPTSNSPGSSKAGPAGASGSPSSPTAPARSSP